MRVCKNRPHDVASPTVSPPPARAVRCPPDRGAFVVRVDGRVRDMFRRSGLPVRVFLFDVFRRHTPVRLGNRRHHLREEIGGSDAGSPPPPSAPTYQIMRAGNPNRASRVLVAQSYFQRFDAKLHAAGQPVPPLGSIICASVLRARGFDVRFFDAMLADSEAECATGLDQHQPDAMVIFEDSFNYLSKMCLGRMREAAAAMIGLARDRGIPVIVSGSDASDDPEFFLRAGAAVVAAGEGEFAVADWLEASGSPDQVPGLVTLDGGGRVLRARSRPVQTDLDAIPSPAWDLIDVARYRAIWGARPGRFSLPLATSRGCPFHCNWCAKPMWGQRYNAVSPRRAAEEVETLRRLGAMQVSVVDDIFGLRPGWVEEFAVELERRQLRLPFKCLSRADLLSERTVAALASAGCEMVWIGAESGAQTILDAMEKGTTVEEIEGAATRLRRAGIKVGFFLQFGYPGETEAEVEKTLALVDRALPDDIGISVSYPLPGTAFHERVRSEMGRDQHWRDSSDLAMLFGGRHTTRYYRRLHAYAHARFRLAGWLRRPHTLGPLRAVQILRYGALRAFWKAGLRLAARDLSPLPALPPGQSRANAATPAGPLS